MTGPVDRTATWTAGETRRVIRPHGATGTAGESDRGSGTVLVVAIVGVVLVLAAGVGVLVRAQSARTAAQTAADLAALAAASSVLAPPGVVLDDPGSAPDAVCRLADEVARRNGGTLTACEVRSGGVVQVTVSRGSLAGVATGTARAGPRSAR